jgi:hypothetical protein
MQHRREDALDTADLNNPLAVDGCSIVHMNQRMTVESDDD